MAAPQIYFNMQLCVAIPTCNRKSMLEKTARSILAQVDTDVRLLIVDNASTDGTDKVIEALAAADPRVLGIYEGEPGSSSARNAALNAAQTEWVLFVDDDEVVDDGWFAAYKAFLSEPPAPNIACVGGPAIADYAGKLPVWFDTRSYNFTQGEVMRRLEAGEGGTGAGNCAYHRARALEVGAFNNALGRIGQFLGAHEETELNSRLRAANYEIWWLPTARIKHFIPASRTTLRYLLQASFGSGRSQGVIAKEAARGKGLGVVSARFSGLWSSGFRVLAYSIGALVMLPAGKGARFVSYLQRATRAAGKWYELMLRDRA